MSPRYHELKGEDNNLCCKIANTGFFTYVGWSYTKMDRNFSLCESEIRPVDLHAYSQKSPVVHKSGFNFRIEDITGGKNYNSAAVDVFDVRQFVEYNHKAGRFDKLRCCKTLFQEEREGVCGEPQALNKESCPHSAM
ncbi:unnamed protein product [Symbiodinium natans]|uniref:Uncharacterized protein n=1 Tax=Symbiodinium natans TaxID=878477 RepID=A0A812HI36_9DINO|nr:unnamed protein product [Symbiodinium natans]